MMQVWKYELRIEDFQTIGIPHGYTLLSVQVQDGTPCLWAKVHPGHDKVPVQIRIAGTGHDLMDSGDTMRYIDTFQMHGGAPIFHVFEIPAD